MILRCQNLFAKAFVIGCIVAPSLAISQDTIAARNQKYIFWQPNAVITYGDYLQSPDSSDYRMKEKYGIGVMGTLEFFRTVDIPKKKRDLAKLGEAVYIAPAFCRECSAMIWEDPKGVEHDRIFFDLAEISVRYARKQLDSIRTASPVDNAGMMFLETLVQDAEDMRMEMMRDYWVQVVVTKSDSAYAEWRSTVDKGLLHTITYATRLEDCQRFIVDKPTKAGYVMPKSRTGDMFPEKRRR